MSLNVQAFLDTLPIMGKGMAGIFIVTGVIILAMILLRAVSDSDQKKELKRYCPRTKPSGSHSGRLFCTD